MEQSRFRFTKVREVKSPSRNHEGDAGLDFYMPENLSLHDLLKANKGKSEYNPSIVSPGQYSATFSDGNVVRIFLGPHTRILIPSGIKVLLEPKASMMQANNKSGKSTKQGLIFTAQVCDSPYTGEYHIGIYNTSNQVQELVAGAALVQFVHVPVFLDTPEEMSNDEYDIIANEWGTRGEKGFGSSDIQQK